MHIINFTVKQADKIVGEVAIREQAVNAAKARAERTGRPVSVIAHMDNGKDREVIFNPDGTNENIWIIDKGEAFRPQFGQTYLNRAGGKYLCIRNMDDTERPEYWNAGGGCSETSAILINVESRWAFEAKGIIRYMDGTIEWGHSVGGHFMEGRT